MHERQREQRQRAIVKSGGVCACCGGSIYQYDTPQYAHKIANTKENRNKYGSFFIDHFLNGDYVCCLTCNHALNIGHDKGKILNLLIDILIYEVNNFGGKNEQ